MALEYPDEQRCDLVTGGGIQGCHIHAQRAEDLIIATITDSAVYSLDVSLNLR